MDTCTKLASQLHLCQPQHVLCADYLHEHWRPDLVRQHTHTHTNQHSGMTHT